MTVQRLHPPLAQTKLNRAADRATCSWPSDAAKPVPVSVTSVNHGVTAGLLEAGDTFVVTFSEPIATGLGPTTTISETDPVGSGNDRLTIAGLTAPAGVATGSNAYILTDNTTASFAASTISTLGPVVTATVAGTCAGNCAANVTSGLGASYSHRTQPCRMPRATPPRAVSQLQAPSGFSEGVLLRRSDVPDGCAAVQAAMLEFARREGSLASLSCASAASIGAS